MLRLALTAALLLALPFSAPAQDARAPNPDLDRLLAEVEAGVEGRAKLAQEIVDKLFSFSELGFQEVETFNYLVPLLRQHGFRVEEGIADIPTAWWATWGSGSPVIALGSDVDGIPRASQYPGVAWHRPIVEDAPGHGEGHNSGQAVNIAAALALKEVMEREGIEGTLILWPGVAEEIIAAKAWFVREGYFENVDVALFTHVSSNLGVSWGGGRGTGLVSVEFTFHGEAAHSAGAPWRGRSALDAVELMNVGWNFRREHLHPNQRSHYVVTDGGDQPNVVPSVASVWYYIREIEYPDIRRNFDIAIRTAEGAAMMTDTEMEYRILGTAWPRHFSRPVAEAVQAHIEAVGLPEWSEEDQLLARAVQLEVGSEPQGLPTEVGELSGPPSQPQSGGSDDIGDISWVVPTITLRFPSNIPGLPGHHWSNSIAMATPISHKGVVAGGKVMARAVLELFMTPELVEDAWRYFREEQTAEQEYVPFIGPDDPPAIHLNRDRQARFRSLLEPFYYDESRYGTYLEQLGVEYPTIRPEHRERLRELGLLGGDPASGAGSGGDGGDPSLQERPIPPSNEEALHRLNASPRHGEWVTYDAGDGDEVRAWVVYPERSDPAPVVVVIHEIFGLTDWIRGVADQLAADGFIAVAPDLLSGMGPDGGGTESVDQQGAVALIRQLERADANRRLRAAADYGTSLPAAAGNAAMLGFCWGGTASFIMATEWADLGAAVVFYGSSPETATLAGVRAPVLGLYAGDDARVNATIEPARDEMARLERRFEVEVYEASGHGFLRQQDGRDGANMRASRAAWPRAVGFLREVLQGG
jgi:aminobenzoyl-glutamate utilization protein B